MNIRRSRPTGDLPDNLRAWCGWIYGHAALAHAANPSLRTPEGAKTTWLDHCGMFERNLVESAIRNGVWSPVEEAA